MSDDEASIRAHLETYYAECRKKDEEERRLLNERLRTDPATRDELAWLEEQNRQQKKWAKLRLEKIKRARREAVRREKIRAEERANLKERVERLLRDRGVRLNLEGDDGYCCGGSSVSIEIDGELLVDDESFDLEMIK